MSKNAIVIGATSGIGRSVAECLVAHGYRVGITGRRIELLQEMVQAAPGSFVAMQMDVMQLEQSVEQLKELIARLGDLDLLMAIWTGNWISLSSGGQSKRMSWE